MHLPPWQFLQNIMQPLSHSPAFLHRRARRQMFLACATRYLEDSGTRFRLISLITLEGEAPISLAIFDIESFLAIPRSICSLSSMPI